MARKKTTKKRTATKAGGTKSTTARRKRASKNKAATKKAAPKGKVSSKKKAAGKKKATAKKKPRRKKKVTSLSLAGARKSVSNEWRDLFPSREHAMAVFKAHRNALLSRPDVTGAHVGLRRDGPDQEIAYPLEYVIRVHVARKWGKDHPMIREMLPPTFSLPGGGGEPVKTDVLESNYQTIASPEDRFLEPVRGGIPIANASLGSTHWGTFGIRMFHGDEPVLLTNRHVIGPGEVIQPPTGKTKDGAKAVVGSYVNGIHDSEVDCAIISDTTPRQVGSGVADSSGARIPGVYVARRLTVADEKRRTPVFKIGARTGRTMAVVKNTSASVKVNGFVMHGQIIAQSTDGSRVIKVGDSGSALISEVQQDGMVTNAVVGLVHAESGDGTMIIACHFDRVQERLGIALS